MKHVPSAVPLELGMPVMIAVATFRCGASAVLPERIDLALCEMKVSLVAEDQDSVGTEKTETCLLPHCELYRRGNQICSSHLLEQTSFELGIDLRNEYVMGIVAVECMESLFEVEGGRSCSGPAGPVRAAARTAIVAVVVVLGYGCYLPLRHPARLTEELAESSGWLV